MHRSPYDLEAISRLMDAVDGIHGSLKLAAQPQNDGVLLAKVREIYVSQGLPVDNHVLNDAFLKVYGREPGAPCMDMATASSSASSTALGFPGPAATRKKRLRKIGIFGGIAAALVGVLLNSLTSIHDPKQLMDTLTGLSFLTGIGLGSLSIIRFKDYAEGGHVLMENDEAGNENRPSRPAVPLSTPIVLMVLASVLIAMPAYLAQLSVVSIG